MSYNTVGVVPINSYNEAVARYEGIKPIRGKTVRPLGERRYHQRSDITVGEDRVFLNYYSQAFVEWRPDDTFTVFPPKYNSAYMIGDLTPYLPFNIGVAWDAGRYVLTIKDEDDKASKRYFLDQPLNFVPKPNGNRYIAQFELAEKPVAYHKRLLPKRVDKYMEKLQPFFDWCDLVEDFDNKTNVDFNMVTKETLEQLRAECGLEPDADVWQKLYDEASKLPHDDPMKEQMFDEWRMYDALPRGGRYGTKYHTPSCRVFLDWLADTSGLNWVKVKTFIVTQAGGYSWKQGAYVVTKTQAREYLKDLILHVHRDDCFKLVPAKDGEVPTKRNAEYFNTFTFSSEIPSAQG